MLVELSAMQKELNRLGQKIGLMLEESVKAQSKM